MWENVLLFASYFSFTILRMVNDVSRADNKIMFYDHNAMIESQCNNEIKLLSLLLSIYCIISNEEESNWSKLIAQHNVTKLNDIEYYPFFCENDGIYYKYENSNSENPNQMWET